MVSPYVILMKRTNVLKRKGYEMTKKNKSVFVCQECGYETEKWMGRCICGAWNSFIEEKVLPELEDDARRRVTGNAKPMKLNSVGTISYERVDTGIMELNRVLGGGIVKGSLTLISGEPGIGKSTLILQAASNITKKGKTVLYISGEESEEQIKLRADRICKEVNDLLLVLSETNMENVSSVVEEIKPDFIIVDSIQTLYSNQIDSAPGSVSQVRVCGNELMKLAKTKNIPIFIVCHVTKSGDLAGPKTVEHLVDSVLNFTGERDQELRILRSFKNRFGTTSEIGAFRMEGNGLIEVSDISKTFIESTDMVSEGTITAATYEGSRPIMFEVQALVTPANIGFARRTAIGFDNNRLNMLLAVMEKKGGLSLLNQDVYVNVVGGIKPEGTGVDLAVLFSIYSSYRGVVLTKKSLAIGEVGLTGDLRSIQNAEKIVKEAGRLGYEQVFLPEKNAAKLKNIEGIDIIGIRNIKDSMKYFKKNSGWD